eukprot:15860121-Heterocapsa_arctica.AAC.1
MSRMHWPGRTWGKLRRPRRVAEATAQLGSSARFRAGSICAPWSKVHVLLLVIPPEGGSDWPR